MMQRTLKKKEKGFKGGRYARTEEELYEKALALLDKCKIERPGTDYEGPESGTAVDDACSAETPTFRELALNWEKVSGRRERWTRRSFYGA